MVNKEFLIYGDGKFRGRLWAASYPQAIKDANRGYSRSTVSSDFERLDFDHIAVVEVLQTKSRSLPILGQELGFERLVYGT